MDYDDYDEYDNYDDDDNDESPFPIFLFSTFLKQIQLLILNSHSLLRSSLYQTMAHPSAPCLAITGTCDIYFLNAGTWTFNTSIRNNWDLHGTLEQWHIPVRLAWQ